MAKTIADATAYMVALPEGRELRQYWQHAAKLILEGASAEAITKQIEFALFMDARLVLTATPKPGNR